jgi:outer membrane cobalamin receptor
MHKKRFYLISFHLCLILSPSFLHADSLDSANNALKKDSVEHLDNIVVTASRTKRLMSETPASVSLISKSMIAASPAKTIEDLLITQPGIQAKRSVAFGEGIPSDIIIRGIPGSLVAPRTLVLVDGIPTNASGTPFLIVNEIPMEAIERIEIVRGPYSSLYGANAFGGVINIITKDGFGPIHSAINAETSYPFNILDQYFSKKRSMATSLKNAGNDALWSVNGTIHGGSEKLGFLADAGYRTIGNYLLRDYSIARDSYGPYRKNPDNHDYKDFRLFGKARYSFSENTELALHLRYFRSDLGFGKTKYILPDSTDITTKGEKILVGPRLSMAITKDFNLRIGGFFRHVTGEFWNEADTGLGNYGQSYWNSQTNDWQAESQATLSMGRHNTLTVGADILRNSADFGAFINPKTNNPLPWAFSTSKAIFNGAGYIQDEMNFFDRLNIVPVMRLDYHSAFGSAFSPKLGISYKLNDMIRLHSSAGRSFRAPSLGELYLPDFPVYSKISLKSRPDLKPEYIWGYDAGFDLVPASNVTIKISSFLNSMSDLIVEKIGANSGVLDTTIYVTHENSLKAWSEGLEGEIRWDPVGWFSLSSHATFEDSRDVSKNVPLNYVPKYLIGNYLTLTHAFTSMKLEGRIGYNYVGNRSYLDLEHATLSSTLSGPQLKLPNVALGSYQTLDVSCKMSFPKRTWLLVAVQNLFNVEYEESPGNLAPGRFATLKIGIDF